LKWGKYIRKADKIKNSRKLSAAADLPGYRREGEGIEYS